MKKTIAMLLAASTLLSTVIMAACSDKESGAGTGGEQSSTAADTVAETTEPENSLEARLSYSDNLPEKNFEGASFAIIGDEQFADYYIVDEINGEIVNDSVYTRNNNVSERFNVVFSDVVYEESAITGNAQKAVLAGDDAYQLVAGHIIYLGMSAINDYMYDWYRLDNVDFSQPWWSSSTIDDLTYKDKAFIAIGDYALSSIFQTYNMFYNKNLAADYNLPDFYGMVNDGGWTLDKMYTYCENVYSDLNGDSKRDEDDRYALVTDCKSNANTYLWAFGKKIATKQNDGTYVLDYYDDKLVSIVNRLYNLYYETDYVYFKTDKHGSQLNVFEKGNTLFANGLIEWSISKYRALEFDYGIIPYPKWDDAQDKYYTSVDGGHEGLAVLKSIQDPEFVGIIIEALNAESWKRTVPAYYDTALKFKGTRDEESIAMLDMICDSRIFDFGYIYGGWGAVFWIQYLLEGASNDIASYYEKNFKAYEKTMEKVFTAFDEFE